MAVTLGQQYNIGEKPTVILYTNINRHAGTPEKPRKQKHCSASSNMVVIIYCYIGCEEKATTWYYGTQSTIELPSAFAESGACPPDRELPGSPRQCSLPLACRHPPEGHQIEARKRRTPENIILSQPYCRRVSTDRPNREGSQLAASLEGEPGPTPAGKTLPHSYPETRFRRERARCIYVCMYVHHT